jgi:type IV pilus assembly protein PilX
LVRSVDTTNVIAGNLAFKQATVSSSDQATEAAVAWLENAGNLLFNDNAPNGYTATEQQPAANQSWDNFWNNTIVPAHLAICVPTNCNQDAAGNVVSYTIHRLCGATGAPGALGVNCSYSPATYVITSSQGTGTVVLNSVNQVYYRITIQVTGPRNTVSYAQAVVAI